MLEASRNVAKVAPTGSHSDVINGVLVESNEDTGEVYLTATNHEVSIQQKIPASVQESGTMLVNARLLVDMMSKLEGDFVNLSADKPQLLNVHGGKCSYRINCLLSDSYPKPVIPFPEESVIMTGICSLAKRTVFAVSENETKPALQCVQIKLKSNAVHAAACDGMRMMLVRDEAESPNEQEFLLYGRSLKLLASVSQDDDVFEVGDIGNQVVFVRGDMIFAINKMITGDFIDTSFVVKNIKPDYTAVADSDKLKEALGLISVAAMMGEKKEPINIVMSDGEIVMSCNSGYSEAGTSVPAKVTKSTPDTGFLYDVTALVKLFNVVGGKVKIEIDAQGYMLVKTPKEVYLQLPLRPSAASPKPVKQDKGKGGSQSEQGDKKKEPKRAKGAGDVKEVA